jgi:tRNA threonylcarbamoyladenosine biosynthesis protein TsaB
LTPPLRPTSPVLFLDAASPVVGVGVQANDESPSIRWREVRGEAGVDLFRAAEALLRETKLAIADLRSAVFCEGPGSLLGVRLVAMALRTWNALPRATPLRVFGYRSLALVAARLIANGEHAPFHVISDARRATWNLLTVAEDQSIGEIQRWPAGETLPETRAVFHPREFPHWQPLPAHAQAVPYPLTALPELARSFPLLRAVDQPDAFLTGLPEYKKAGNLKPES